MFRASVIVHAQGDPVVVAEIELGNVPVQVLLGAVLIDALHAALEDAVIALNRVGVDRAAPIFASPVADEIVPGEMLVEVCVLPRLIRHDRGFLGDVGAEDRHEVRRRRAVDMERPNHPAALDQGQDRVLVGIAASFDRAFLLSDEGLVYLDDFALSPEGHELAIAHGFAQPMRHEPSGLVGDAENAVDLVAAHSLLAGAEKVRSLEPQMQLDVAALEHGFDGSRELLLALAATPKTDPAALNRGNPIDSAAMRADRTFRPNQAFQLGVSGGFVVEELGGECGTGHGVTP